MKLTLRVRLEASFGDLRARICAQAARDVDELRAVRVEPDAGHASLDLHLVGRRHFIEHCADFRQALRLLGEQLLGASQFARVAKRRKALELRNQVELRARAVELVALLDDDSLQLELQLLANLADLARELLLFASQQRLAAACGRRGCSRALQLGAAESPVGRRPRRALGQLRDERLDAGDERKDVFAVLVFCIRAVSELANTLGERTNQFSLLEQRDVAFARRLLQRDAVFLVAGRHFLN